MEQKASTARVALKYGVLGAVVIMIYTTIINVSGLSQNQVLTTLSFVFTIAAIVLGMKEFREQNKGFMSYGEGLGLGTLLSAVMGFLVSMFSTFYNKFIDPSIVTQAIDKARSDMELRGMDDAQIDQSLEVVQKFMSPGIMFAMGVFMSILIGFIVSLVVSAIIRREKPVFE